MDKLVVPGQSPPWFSLRPSDPEAPIVWSRLPPSVAGTVRFGNEKALGPIPCSNAVPRCAPAVPSSSKMRRRKAVLRTATGQKKKATAFSASTGTISRGAQSAPVRRYCFGTSGRCRGNAGRRRRRWGKSMLISTRADAAREAVKNPEATLVPPPGERCPLRKNLRYGPRSLGVAMRFRIAEKCL